MVKRHSMYRCLRCRYTMWFVKMMGLHHNVCCACCCRSCLTTVFHVVQILLKSMWLLFHFDNVKWLLEILYTARMLCCHAICNAFNFKHCDKQKWKYAETNFPACFYAGNNVSETIGKLSHAEKPFILVSTLTYDIWNKWRWSYQTLKMVLTHWLRNRKINFGLIP